MSAGPIKRAYFLFDKTATDLIDVAEDLALGDGGRTFHFDIGSYRVVAFSSPEHAMLFKLAYSGHGNWIGDELVAPENELAEILTILVRHDMQDSVALIELVEVSLPCAREHDDLLAALNAGGPVAVSFSCP
jgi:hypothetical protein